MLRVLGRQSLLSALLQTVACRRLCGPRPCRLAFASTADYLLDPFQKRFKEAANLDFALGPWEFFHLMGLAPPLSVSFRPPLPGSRSNSWQWEFIRAHPCGKSERSSQRRDSILKVTLGTFFSASFAFLFSSFLLLPPWSRASETWSRGFLIFCTLPHFLTARKPSRMPWQGGVAESATPDLGSLTGRPG